MSRLNNPGMISTRPVNNVYTGLAFISMLATLGALIYVIMRLLSMNMLK